VHCRRRGRQGGRTVPQASVGGKKRFSCGCPPVTRLTSRPAWRSLTAVATRVYITTMRKIEVRELKNRLIEYLRHARAGETVLVTRRGEVVAELAPPGRSSADSSLPPGITDLARRGLLTLGSPSAARVYPRLSRVLRHSTSAELLEQEREGR
jgi:antitoxin (DNA-binding transcriptional repressor) of toxin-antitoxin stability system